MNNRLYQISTLQALLAGYYQPSVTAAELLRHGDTGLGTFARADGEMIVLDGHVYQAGYDGTVSEADPSAGIPFGTVTFFHADQHGTMTAADMEDVRKKLDDLVSLHSNRMAVVKMEGLFEMVHYRSGSAVPAGQDIPLADWLDGHQNEWTNDEIRGTAVGIYFPSWMDRVNAPGWHLHFLSADHCCGGHVLGMKVRDIQVSVSWCGGFEMVLPEGEQFEQLDLNRDQSQDIDRAEKAD
jgi:acetolactate decarboxylase